MANSGLCTLSLRDLSIRTCHQLTSFFVLHLWNSMSGVKPHGSHASNSQHTTRSTVLPTYTCNLHYARTGLERILLRAHTHAHTASHANRNKHDPKHVSMSAVHAPSHGLRSACTPNCVIGRRHGRILVAQTAVWFEGLLTSWVLGDAE